MRVLIGKHYFVCGITSPFKGREASVSLSPFIVKKYDQKGVSGNKLGPVP